MGFSIDYGVGGVLGAILIAFVIGAVLIAVVFFFASVRKAEHDVEEETGEDETQV